MNMVMTLSAGAVRFCRLGLMLLVLSFGVSANAQDILAGAQIGTVQENREDDGFIVISGRNYNFDNEVSRVFLGQERVDSVLLSEGVVVRFTVNRQGILERLEIIGPAARFANLNEH